MPGLAAVVFAYRLARLLKTLAPPVGSSVSSEKVHVSLRIIVFSEEQIFRRAKHLHLPRTLAWLQHVRKSLHEY